MVNLDNYLSHKNPDKKLVDHIYGVVNNVKKRSDSKVAELSAIFHDIGKMNPNFQEKLRSGKSSGYSNHAYFSAYVFLCFCSSNYNWIKETLGENHLLIRSIAAIIAHHHGDLPNFEEILSNEKNKLESFLQTMPPIPFYNFIKEKLIIYSNDFIVVNNPFQDNFLNLCVQQKELTDHLNFYLDTQFSFAALVTADKEDASGYKSICNIDDFCKKYNPNLDKYLNSLEANSQINIMRTKIRNEALENISRLLNQDKRIFSLTSPTGSGKTLMLLSLAGKILAEKGNLRIIYALPFLSITEQVEKECSKVFNEYKGVIARIDSKTENKQFEIYQDELDGNPDAIKRIIETQFAEDIFDYPFIITTFVKIFETLLSNKNATLLKLPNFANTIFLIDEIQALPPRLYGFFVALLDTFCQKYNSYVIISSATMPNFHLPDNNKHDLISFFCNYSIPPELVSFDYFHNSVFNRYKITRIQEEINIEDLSNKIESEESSVLVILNTIDDTKLVYQQLKDNTNNQEVVLLNTHFTPHDRTEKISRCKTKLFQNNKVILISTQLIEAGVDIDFPIVYRDMAPLPNIIQSAGRCNRNGKYASKGKVVLFTLKRNDTIRANLIYRGNDKIFLDYSLSSFKNVMDETSSFTTQKKFFDLIQHNTLFATHQSEVFETNNNGVKEIDFIKKIKEAAFTEIGKFRLIDEKKYGEEINYYIPRDEKDSEFEKLEDLYSQLVRIPFASFSAKKLKLIEVENQIRKMSNRIIHVRVNKTQIQPIADKDSCFEIYKLSNSYTFEEGINLSTANQII